MAFMNGLLYVLSSIDSTKVLIFIVTLLTLLFYIRTRRDGRMPPGPPLLPILGNILSVVGKDSLDKFMLLGKKYGDVYGLYIGQELTVVLNSFDAVSDALLKKGSLFTRRPVTPFTAATDHYTGVLTAYDELWKEERNFAQMALQTLCFKNKSMYMEELILQEAWKLLDKLENLKGPVNPKQYLSISSANVLSSIIWSKSFDLDDPDFSTFLEEMGESELSYIKKLVVVNCFPFLLKLPFDILDLKMIYRGPLKWHSYLEKRIENNDKLTDKTEDFVNLYLDAIDETQANLRGQTFTTFQLKNTSFDLLIGGSETTATTLNWLLLYILNDPDLQARLHTEIDDVIEKDRPPSLTDRPRMPYMEATILEALRIAPPAPLGFPHTVPHDATFRGYLIRENTTVVTNIYSVHRDPKLWDDPTEFRPERFLSEDMTTLEIPKWFIPFSLGPRSCLGETLAKMQLFLFMTSLLQRFKLLPSDDQTVLETKTGVFGSTFNPVPYEVRFLRRESTILV